MKKTMKLAIGWVHDWGGTWYYVTKNGKADYGTLEDWFGMHGNVDDAIEELKKDAEDYRRLGYTVYEKVGS